MGSPLQVFYDPGEHMSGLGPAVHNRKSHSLHVFYVSLCLYIVPDQIKRVRGE